MVKELLTSGKSRQRIVRSKKDKLKDVNGIDAAILWSYIERIERLTEEKKALTNEIKEVFKQVKYNDKIDLFALRELLKMRENDKRECFDGFIVEQYYKLALGME